MPSLCTKLKPHRNTGRSTHWPCLMDSPAPDRRSIYQPRSRRRLNTCLLFSAAGFVLFLHTKKGEGIDMRLPYVKST